jgi:hypothetical protein
MRHLLILLSAICSFFWVARAEAIVRIDIDLTHQSMHVVGSDGDYIWPVSTARSGYATPRGSFSPYSLQRVHYSRKYHMSPMPYSIFFHGGYAIHGTYATSQLGRPASHGCIRLAPANAARLFAMVQSEGAAISISGAPHRGAVYAKVQKKHGAHYATRHRAHQPMAYAPVKRMPAPVNVWQYDPAMY